MNWPTQEQVERALRDEEYGEGCSAASFRVLAAEVRVLRAKFEQRLDATVKLEALPLFEEIDRLRATLARVEALVPKWLDYVVLQTGEGIPDCAADLEAALRGEPAEEGT